MLHCYLQYTSPTNYCMGLPGTMGSTGMEYTATYDYWQLPTIIKMNSSMIEILISFDMFDSLHFSWKQNHISSASGNMIWRKLKKILERERAAYYLAIPMIKMGEIYIQRLNYNVQTLCFFL